MRAKMYLEMAKAKVSGFMRKRVDGIEGVVVAIILIAVAIGVCVLFKEQIQNFVNNMFNEFNTETFNLM